MGTSHPGSPHRSLPVASFHRLTNDSQIVQIHLYCHSASEFQLHRNHCPAGLIPAEERHHLWKSPAYLLQGNLHPNLWVFQTLADNLSKLRDSAVKPVPTLELCELVALDLGR